MCLILKRGLQIKTDHELVEKICSGDEAAFEQLVAENRRLVEHIVHRMIPNAADREEICQDIFLRVFLAIKNFQFKSSLSTWIGRISYNTSLNYLRKKGPTLYNDIKQMDKMNDTFDAQFQSVEVQPDEYSEVQDRNAALYKLIERLPAVHQTILILYHMNGKSYAEIAEIMQLPEGTVKSYLFRARKALKKHYESQFQGEEI
jgi:RNA polymerase sigma-70 factor (ECF subfamily)